MARTILPILGGAVGFIVGGPAGARWGWMIGSLVGGIVDPQVIKGPRIGDIGVQTSRDGVPRPIVYGTAPVVGNVIDRGEYVKTIEREQQGKGGPVVETERVSLTFAIRICEGPVAGITRIWEDEKLVYDVRPGSLIPDDSADFFNDVEIYLGDESQLPDPSLETIHGVGTTPAYRGTCYIVFKDKDLTERRGSIPSYRFEVATDADVTLPDIVPGWMAGQLDYDDRLYTIDGTDWEVSKVHNPPSATGYEYCTYVNGKTVLSGPIGTIYTSADKGLTWSGPNSIAPASPSAGGGRIGWNGTYYYLCCGVNYLARSTDLITWSIPLSDNKTRANDLVVGSGIICVVSIYSPYANFSTDEAATFTTGSVSVFGSGASNPDGALRIETDGNKLVFFGRTGGPSYNRKLSYSGDGGDTWALGTFSFSGDGSGVQVAGLKYSHGNWVAVSSDGNIKYSTNGTSWTDSAYTFTGPKDLDADGSKFIIVGDDGLIASSPTGQFWTVLPTIYTDDYNTVCALGVTEPAPPVVEPGESLLSYIVQDLCERNSVDSTEIDVTELTDLVDGFTVAGVYSAGECIKSLQRVYFFDSGEWDGVLHFVKRGGEIVETISESDMLEEPEETTREQELEFPKKMHLSYQNAELGYAPTKQTVSRSSPDIRVVGEVTVEVPVVLDKDQAAQVCDKLMKVAWVDTGGEIKFKVADNKSYLTPTDCVNLNIRDRTYRARIERVECADGVVNVQARHDRQSSYFSNAVGEQPPDPLDPVSSLPGITYFEFINCPSLIDADDRLGYYIACRGELEPWQGCTVERSIDGGATYSTIANVTTAARMGQLLDNVSAASEYVLDTTNQIRFQMYGPDDSDMPSITYTQLLQEGNAILVGDEIMQYQDATEESPGVWVLTTLVRGRLATSSAAHTAGDRVVLLSGATFIETSSSLLGVELTHRATSYGNSPEDSTEYVNTWSPAYSQLEFSPCFLELERDGADVITATWTPRYRFGTTVNPIQSVNDRGFRVSFGDGSTTITLPDSYSTTATYDASALGSPVTVTVQPINRITNKTGPNVSGVI